MAATQQPISFDFTKLSPGDPLEGLTWYNPPESVTIEPGQGLRVVPKPNTDFWRKTYLSPPPDRATGHALLYKIPDSVESCVAEMSFSLNPAMRYDQAGVMVLIDKEHWLKAGIEVEDDLPRMSCVVTNGQSDWSYKTWSSSHNIDMRVEFKRYGADMCECLIQHKDTNGEWTFLREAPLSLVGGCEGVSVGVMCCAPKKEVEKKGMDVVFHRLCITQQ